MSRLPSSTGKQLIAALKRLGFDEIRIRGSHHYLRHPDGRATVVPVHAGESIGQGLVSKILRDCEIDRDELAANF
jgi:predicted RNA binding protein YcfA (HicA-like mRNA interferase family)